MSSGTFQAPGGVALAGEWQRVDVAASLTDSALTINGISTATQRGAPFEMRAVGISLSGSTAATGANLTCALWIDGVVTSLVGTLIAGQTIGFGHGDVTIRSSGVYELKITTPGGWTSTTLDLVASLFTAP